jgi:hypothetical protein
MKKMIFTLLAAMISLCLFGQGGDKGNGKSKNNVSQSIDHGNSQKDKEKGKEKDKEKKLKGDSPGQIARDKDHDMKVWEGVGDKSCMKLSKSQPSKVSGAFQRDFPRAFNVQWTKCRGDWTATFNNGIFRSTAVYHANGDRKDTRTLVYKEDIPKRVFEGIFKRFPGIQIEDAIKIEVPNKIRDIFRIKNIVAGNVQYNYYDNDGDPVTYDY